MFFVIVVLFFLSIVEFVFVSFVYGQTAACVCMCVCIKAGVLGLSPLLLVLYQIRPPNVILLHFI